MLPILKGGGVKGLRADAAQDDPRRHGLRGIGAETLHSSADPLAQFSPLTCYEYLTQNDNVERYIIEWG